MHFSIRVSVILATSLSLLFLLPATSLACGDNSPAKPVPQFHEVGGPSLWPLDLTGQIKLRPAAAEIGVVRDQMRSKPIDADEDSTDYTTNTTASESFGHELFQEVSIPGTRDQNAPGADFAVVVYGAGLQVWDIATDPGDPIKKAGKDGFDGEWAAFGKAGEADGFLHAGDVVKSGSALLIGAAGMTDAGFSIWRWDAGVLTQKYQDLNANSTDVSMVTDPNGRIYAFVGDEKSVRVYDVTSASQLGNGSVCLDQNGSYPCGVYKGQLGDMSAGRFVSALVVDGETYVAASDGSGNSNKPVKLEIWEVRDPSSPGAVPNGGSVLRFDGRGQSVHSPTLFTYDGSEYVAFVENKTMYLYGLGSCLSSGCSSLPSLKAEEDLKWKEFPTVDASWHYLDVSFSEGQPFLHYGMETSGLYGSGFERLWELAQLPNSFAKNTLPELTDGGGTYIEACRGLEVDYFGDYYNLNEFGLRNFRPHHAVFNGPYLYRTSRGLFDVHIRGGVVQTSDPLVVTQIDPSNTPIDGGAGNEFWLDDSVVFTAAVSNCVPEIGKWCWDASTTQADVTFTPTGDFEGCDPFFTGIHDITFACDAAGRCPDASATVAAWNEACGTPESDGSSQKEATVLLKDPTVEVLSTSGSGTFPQCTQVTLDATVGGRGSASWHWEIEGVDVPGCSGTTGAIGGDLEAENFPCTWDTTGVEFSTIFTDGFDTGNCGYWSSAKGLPGCSAASLLATESATAWTPSKVKSLEKADAATFLATLIVDGLANQATASFEVTIEEVGDPAFSNPSDPLSTPALSGSSATLEAPATDTTLWTWEIEDPDNGKQACSFNSGKSCVVEETTGDSISYLWLGGGTYTYEVSLSNCKSSGSVSATGTVTVEDSATANITKFAISSDDVQSSLNGFTGPCCVTDVFASPREITCPANTVITFDLELAEAGSFTYWMDWTRTDTSSSNLAVQSPASGSGTTLLTFETSFSSGLVGTTVFPLSAAGNNVKTDEQALDAQVKIGSCG